MGGGRPFFPEPSEADESWPGWDETAVDWFLRSTQPRARAVREFLNRSLGYFSDDHARGLVGKLRQDWQSFFFEIVVGRYLQVLNATVEPEPMGSNGTRVDFRATFPDGVVVSVECVSKRFNLEAQRKQQRYGKMASRLDAVGPKTWAIRLDRLPEANSEDEFKPYVDAAAAWYETLPEAEEGGERLSFRFAGTAGQMAIEAIPFPKGTQANHLGPAVGFTDDSVQRVVYALRDKRKRRQAEGAFPPVLLAIDCPFMGPEADDFDQALFGSTVDHRGFDIHESVGTSFDSKGVLVADRGVPFAGVLAFLNMSMVSAGDPVLYVNPYQRWKWPAAIAAHEQRQWVAKIETTPANRKPLINSIGFVDYSEPSP
jgi:hypothetical protein